MYKQAFNAILQLFFQMTISQLKAELEKGPQEAAVYTQQIHQLQSDLNNVQQQSQVMCTAAETVRQLFNCIVFNL